MIQVLGADEYCCVWVQVHIEEEDACKDERDKGLHKDAGIQSD